MEKMRAKKRCHWNVHEAVYNSHLVENPGIELNEHGPEEN